MMKGVKIQRRKKTQRGTTKPELQTKVVLEVPTTEDESLQRQSLTIHGQRIQGAEHLVRLISSTKLYGVKRPSEEGEEDEEDEEDEEEDEDRMAELPRIAEVRRPSLRESLSSLVTRSLRYLRQPSGQPPLAQEGEEMLHSRFQSYLMQSSFHKQLAEKLLGDHTIKQRFLQEDGPARHTACCLIHPGSLFRFIWDLTMIVIVLSSVIVVPLRVAFNTPDFTLPWKTYNVITDIIFIIDVIFNLRTGYLEVQNYTTVVVMDPGKVMRHYLRTWFLLDFVTSIPFDVFIIILKDYIYYGDKKIMALVNIKRTMRLLKPFRFLSLLRVFRLIHILQYSNQWIRLVSLANVSLHLIRLIFFMVIVLHWFSCAYYLVDRLLDYPDNGWVMMNKLKEVHLGRKYTAALFQALSNMFTIGYGRFPPSNLGEVWLCNLSMFVGAVFYIIVLAHATNLLSSLYVSRRQYTYQLLQLQEYITHSKLPKKLCAKIINFFKARYRGEKIFDEQWILSQLSDPLKRDIIRHTCQPLMYNSILFDGAEENFIADMSMHLKPLFAQPGDYILHSGTYGDKMYLIESGTLQVLYGDDETRVLDELQEGENFGAICLLQDMFRVTSVYAKTNCQLYVLHRSDAHKVLAYYPREAARIQQVVTSILNIPQNNPQCRAYQFYVQKQLMTGYYDPSISLVHLVPTPDSVDLSKFMRSSDDDDDEVGEEMEDEEDEDDEVDEEESDEDDIPAEQKASRAGSEGQITSQHKIEGPVCRMRRLGHGRRQSF